MTSRLTRSGPFSRLSRRNPGQYGVLFRRDRLSPNQLNHQDPFILRHGSQPTANRLPLLDRGDLCKAHCSVLVKRFDTFTSRSTPTARSSEPSGAGTDRCGLLHHMFYLGLLGIDMIIRMCLCEVLYAALQLLRDGYPN